MSCFIRLPLALASPDAFGKRVLVFETGNPINPTMLAWESVSEVRSVARGVGWASPGALPGGWATRGGKLYPWRSTAAGAPAGAVAPAAVAGEKDADAGTRISFPANIVGSLAGGRSVARGAGWGSPGALWGGWATRGGKLYPWRSTAAGAPAGVVAPAAVAGTVMTLNA